MSESLNRKNRDNMVLSADKPLNLVNFTIIKENGKVSNMLKLAAQIEEIAISNGLCLIGNSITLTIPKYVRGKCGNKLEHLLFIGKPLFFYALSAGDAKKADFRLPEGP